MDIKSIVLVIYTTDIYAIAIYLHYILNGISNLIDVSIIDTI